MRGLLLLVTIIILTGCAGLTEQEMADYTKRCSENSKVTDVEECVRQRVKDEREYRTGVRDSEFLDEFLKQQQLCVRTGGQMHIERRMGIPIKCRIRDNCPPVWGDRYGCSHSGAGVYM